MHSLIHSLFALIHIELKSALKSLGAQYPEAYEQFIHHLQSSPSSGRSTAQRQTSEVRNSLPIPPPPPPSSSSPTSSSSHYYLNSKMPTRNQNQAEVVEEPIVVPTPMMPAPRSDSPVPVSVPSRLVGTTSTSMSSMSSLPPGTARVLVGNNREHLIGELVDTMPQGDVMYPSNRQLGHQVSEWVCVLGGGVFHWAK